MMLHMDRLLVYREFPDGQDAVLRRIDRIASADEEEMRAHADDCRKLYCESLHELAELAGDYGFSGNLWHCYLTWLLVSQENAFSLACEIKGPAKGSIRALAKQDFAVFRELFALDFTAMERRLSVQGFAVIKDYINEPGGGRLLDKHVRERICDLAALLAQAKDVDAFADALVSFYQDFGTGKFGMHRAFRLAQGKDGVQIVPVTKIADVDLDDLVGYETAKQKLVENTEAFLCGRTANNCLLFGDAGTGKSSSIKAILNRYADRGLRIIEIYKHQFEWLNDVIAQLKGRGYRFLIFMDDLSFEDFEIEYKYLKAVIEGGIEQKPENILIYATSNRRHLVREKFSDREDQEDDRHTSDTVQEKLSLAYRFGLQIFFGAPSPKEFQNIVRVLAKRCGITMPEEELLQEANRWEMQYGGLSGRTAQQFIDHLCAVMEGGSK